MRKVLLALAAVAVTYGAAEALATALFVRGWLEPRSLWMHERTNPTGNLRFDPVRGARLSARPARIACVATNGALETTGVYRGNNHGFPDRDDFGPERPDPQTVRIAVFGDSFTHAQFIDTNWPDRVEDRAREEGRRLQLLNFALDGVGLANWASVLTRFVVPGRFELDGVVFAVWGSDLGRRFTWWSDAPRGRGEAPHPVTLGIASGWDLAGTPRTPQEAAGMPDRNWWVVSPERLDRALAGDWLPPFERPWRPFLATRARRAWERLSGTGAYAPGPGRFEPGQLRLIAQIREALGALGVPALVARVPNLPELPSWEGEAERFARRLGARFADGFEAFAELDPAEYESCWLPYDRHWNQKGSDRFAEWMLRQLAAWP